MRERLGEEMSVNDTSLALLNDVQLLNSYYTCKYVFLINKIHLAEGVKFFLLFQILKKEI